MMAARCGGWFGIVEDGAGVAEDDKERRCGVAVGRRSNRRRRNRVEPLRSERATETRRNGAAGRRQACGCGRSRCQPDCNIRGGSLADSTRGCGGGSGRRGRVKMRITTYESPRLTD